jgi:lipoprotein-anchoring transpeptidase ErfK/SrfK
VGRVICGPAGMLALVVLTACASTASGNAEELGAKVPDAAVSVSPADRSVNVATGETVLVAARSGTLSEVKVSAGGAVMAGAYSADRTQWRSKRTAKPGVSYTVQVTAANSAGRTTTTTSTFSTVKATKYFEIEHLVPHRDDTGLTVGVGMPIMITFDRDISDRLTVERNLFVRSSKPVEGAWHWFDDRHVDFRPREYWPAHTKVRLEARLAGVRGGQGLYGKRDRTLDFTVGRAQITKGSTDSHVLRVRRDGKLVREMPMSAGQGGVWKYHTTSGVHLAMSREAVTVMTSPGIGPGQSGYYQMTVYNTVRISNSGEYVHSAPWSVGSQGNSNVSHGCVNISPSNAAWFIEHTLIGDPIIITGSPRTLEPTNGWGHWQEDWKQWLKWSVIKSGRSEDL